MRHGPTELWKRRFFNILNVCSASINTHESNQLQIVTAAENCDPNKSVWTPENEDPVCGQWIQGNGFHLQITVSLLGSRGSIFWTRLQPTLALVDDVIGAFFQQGLIDWPSTERRSSHESKQTWMSRPAKSLVSIPSARKAKPDLIYLWSDKTATTSSYCEAAWKPRQCGLYFPNPSLRAGIHITMWCAPGIWDFQNLTV